MCAVGVDFCIKSVMGGDIGFCVSIDRCCEKDKARTVTVIVGGGTRVAVGCGEEEVSVDTSGVFCQPGCLCIRRRDAYS
jgi:hypothetical protein